MRNAKSLLWAKHRTLPLGSRAWLNLTRWCSVRSRSGWYQACLSAGSWDHQTLKGISTPLAVYQVVGESQAQSRFDVAVRKGLTPLVGREEELGLLQRRWEQAKTGNGQVVLLSGEPGIGKSRLVQALTEHVLTDGATRIEFRCSPITKTAPSIRSLSICSGSCSLPKTMLHRSSLRNFNKSFPTTISLRPILFR